jgi:hypothetical protein
MGGRKGLVAMSIATENILFDWRVNIIEHNARAIESQSHLYDKLQVYDTALQKMQLRLSAKALRAAADHIEKIERELVGPETAFPVLLHAAE